ncbi:MULTISPECIES: PH domain-containing protein [unclassified Pseudoclavibacter]|uniref:PH domain-containing protein n=1 Tax=unclassified Pseudoclavibacter TaxID=2615177 RepID=UPI001BA5088D|nr:PH domain-containing protein [Pseudoclavibacter sp. Marseille-Q4354]MBS3177780.1 PH domain-containing protein [Pseudoclavibacter sp. Marseille-Q4354]
MPRFNPAPGWPAAPEGWMPHEGWQPDPTWPAAPEGWQVVVDDRAPAPALTTSAPAAVSAPRVAEPSGSSAEPTTSRAAAALSKFRTATGSSSATGASVGEDSDVSSDDLIWEGSSKTMTGVGGGRYRLTRYYLHFERGMLSTNGQQIGVERITDVDVRQSMAQKARGVSDLVVHTDAESVILESIPDVREVQQLINEVARARKHELQRRQRLLQQPVYAHPPAYSAPSAAPAPATPAAQTAGPDLIDRLQQLTDLHLAGALTDEEFSAAKKQALGL